MAAKANGSAIDGRTTRHAAYKVSQVIRKRIEEVFGWTKSAAGLRKPARLGRVGWQFTLTMAASLIRLPKLLAASHDQAARPGAPSDPTLEAHRDHASRRNISRLRSNQKIRRSSPKDFPAVEAQVACLGASRSARQHQNGS